MNIRCYAPDCKNVSPNVPWWKYIFLSLKLWDRRFYVCEEHYYLFRPEDTYEDICLSGKYKGL